MQSLVVKMGSSSVTRPTGPDPVLLTGALDAALEARSAGWSVILVSSGAVSSGSAYLSRHGGNQPSRRLAAAVGQPFLMDIYRSVADISGAQVCQLLISESDLHSSTQMSTIAQILEECAADGIVPIVNGNDVTDPLGSDNDAVAVGISVASAADKLLLLTDVPGVYMGQPEESPLLSDLDVEDLRTVRIMSTGTGRGGMRSKLRAAELAAYNGIETTIADAREAQVISRCIRGESVGTRVKAVPQRFSKESRWIAGIASSHGSLVVNRDAEASVRSGSSLFASGIKKVRGNFSANSIVDVVNPSGQLVARGVSKVSAVLLTLVRAMRTDEVADIMTEAVFQFYSASSHLSNKTQNKENRQLSHISAPRPQVKKAFDIISTYSFENKRKLALEIICLFPSATAEAMIGYAAGQWSEHLRLRYMQLSSDLSLIDRDHLAVFSRP